jgi:hypothetical protein
LAYLIGLLLGAGISTVVVYSLGLLWRPSALLVGVLAVILGLGRVFFPRNVAAGGWKVPRNWELWGPVRYLGAFGLFLGMGFVTTMPSPTMVVLIAWMWHLHSLPLILVTFEGFALGRVLTTALMFADRDGAPVDGADRANALIAKLSFLPRIEAVTSMALGVALFALLA